MLYAAGMNLVSAPLCRFYLIANGILYRHWYHPGVNKPWLALGIMVYFTAVSLGAFLLSLPPCHWQHAPGLPHWQQLRVRLVPYQHQISAYSSPVHDG